MTKSFDIQFIWISLIASSLMALFVTAADAQSPCRFGLAYGAPYDLDTGLPVVTSPDTLLADLRQVLECARSQLPVQDSALLDRTLSDVLRSDDEILSSADAVLLEIGLISRLLDTSELRKQEIISGKIFELAGTTQARDFFSDPQFYGILASNGFTARPRTTTPANAMDVYVDNCRHARVPVPNAIETDANWRTKDVDLGDDYKKFFLRSEHEIARLWRYSGDTGGECIALLRQDQDDDSGEPIGEAILSTICTSEPDMHGKRHACFFDNYVYGASGQPERLDLQETLETDYADLAHPTDVSFNCFACHLGDNPFIVQPNLNMTQYLNPTLDDTDHESFEYVEFGLGLESWSNRDPVRPPQADQRACMSCHDIPNVATGEFCSVLKSMAQSSMPPGYYEHHDIMLWPDAPIPAGPVVTAYQKYLKSVDFLRFNMCGY